MCPLQLRLFCLSLVNFIPGKSALCLREFASKCKSQQMNVGLGPIPCGSTMYWRTWMRGSVTFFVSSCCKKYQECLTAFGYMLLPSLTNLDIKLQFLVWFTQFEKAKHGHSAKIIHLFDNFSTGRKWAWKPLLYTSEQPTPCWTWLNNLLCPIHNASFSLQPYVSLGPELTMDNPFDSLQRSWISWCPVALGFWVVL